MSYSTNNNIRDPKRPRFDGGGSGGGSLGSYPGQQRGGGGGGFGRGGMQQHQQYGSGGMGRRGPSGAAKWGDGPRPNSIVIMTNQFKLKDPTKTFEYFMQQKWVKYDVTIFDALRKKLQDEEGKFSGYSFLPRLKHSLPSKVLMESGSNAMSRRILRKLQQRLFAEDKFFWTDGTKLAIAANPLFDANGADEGIVQAATMRDTVDEHSSAIGRYGPADLKTDTGGHKAPTTGIYYDFHVLVKKSCEDDDPDADRVENAHFIVRFQDVGFVQSSTNVVENVYAMQTAMEIALKNSMMASKLKVYGKSPRFFYLDPEPRKAHDILGSLAGAYSGANSNEFPHIGLSQSVRFCTNGNVFVSFDAGLDWFYREKSSHRDEPIPIIDDRQGKIAGVRVNSLHHIIPVPQRAEIERELKKLTLNMKYSKANYQEKEEALRNKLMDEGKSVDVIESQLKGRRRFNTKVYRNVVVGDVIWDVDRPEHMFDYCESKISVAQYFDIHHKLKLRFPMMPLIIIKYAKNINKRRKDKKDEKDASTAENGELDNSSKVEQDYEKFPLEFFSQAWSKVRGADHNPDVLKFNDQFSSTDRINHLKIVKALAKEQCGPELSMLLQQLHLTTDLEPATMTAKVLPQPMIRFQSSEATPSDGSWNLTNVKFSKPGFMSSFAIIDLACSSYENGLALNDTRFQAFDKLFDVMARHGIEMPPNREFHDSIRHVMVSTKLSVDTHKEDMYNAFDIAIKKAKAHFLHDTFNNLGFLTSIESLDHSKTSLAIVRKIDDEKFEAILPVQVAAETHIISHTGSIDPVNVRKMAMVSGKPVDLFSLRLVRGTRDRFERKNDNGFWEPVEFHSEYCYLTATDEMFLERDVSSSEAHHVVSSDQIECPSIVFVRLPNDNTQVYHLVKYFSNVKFKVQSQCFVNSKYQSQRNPDQYNIATKVNTKLFSNDVKARAWDIEVVRHGNIPWLDEAPTMVMGISLTRGMGNTACTIVSAAVSLENQGKCGTVQLAMDYRVQLAAGVVEEQTMYTLFEKLSTQYFLFNDDVMPSRVIVYRNGSSEGNFDHVLNSELAALRKALYDLRQKRNLGPCVNERKCQHNGCTFCTPILTYILALSQHNIRMVPAEKVMPRRGPALNVPSGTCLDHTVTPYLDGKGLAAQLPETDCDNLPDDPRPVVFSNPASDGFDFLLTAHGGLKGTSKPIFYRVVLNENFVWRPWFNGERCTPLTKETFQQMTYAMSYQYGTATKAVRMVPVVKYAVKLGNIVLGYQQDLANDETVRCKKGLQVPFHPYLAA